MASFIIFQWLAHHARYVSTWQLTSTLDFSLALSCSSVKPSIFHEINTQNNALWPAQKRRKAGCDVIVERSPLIRLRLAKKELARSFPDSCPDDKRGRTTTVPEIFEKTGTKRYANFYAQIWRRF